MAYFPPYSILQNRIEFQNITGGSLKNCIWTQGHLDARTELKQEEGGEKKDVASDVLKLPNCLENVSDDR